MGGSVSINLTESCVSSCVTFKQWIFENLHLKIETNLPSSNETKKYKHNYKNFFQYVMLVEWLATFLFVNTIPIQFRDAKVKVKISHLNLAFLQSRLQFPTRIRPKPLNLSSLPSLNLSLSVNDNLIFSVWWNTPQCCIKLVWTTNIK